MNNPKNYTLFAGRREIVSQVDSSISAR